MRYFVYSLKRASKACPFIFKDCPMGGESCNPYTNLKMKSSSRSTHVQLNLLIVLDEML